MMHFGSIVHIFQDNINIAAMQPIIAGDSK